MTKKVDPPGLFSLEKMGPESTAELIYLIQEIATSGVSPGVGVERPYFYFNNLTENGLHVGRVILFLGWYGLADP